MFPLRPIVIVLAFFTALQVPVCGAEPKGKEALTLAQATEQVKKQRDDAVTGLQAEWPKLATLEARAGQGADTVRQRKKVADLLKTEVQKDIDYQRLLDFQAHAQLADDAKTPETYSVEQWLALAKKSDPIPFTSGATPLPAYDYSAIEKHVLEASKDTTPAETGPTHSIPELAKFLTAGAKNDREKAWALAYWVSHNLAYDYDAFQLEPKEIVWLQQVDEVFKRRAALCEGHGRLLQALGEAAGLEMKYVAGHMRSPGELREAFRKYTDTTSDGLSYTTHGWNVVKLGDRWYLLDATNGDANAKRDGQLPKEKKAPHTQNYLLPVEWAIFSHVPRVAEEEMLKTPLSRQETEQLPLPALPYFTYGLKLEAPFAPAIKAEDNATVVIRVPLKYQLRAELDEINLQEGKRVRVPVGHCLVQRTDELVRLHVTAPNAGTYFLTLFAGAADPLDVVLTYRVEFTGKNNKETSLPTLTKDYYDRKGSVLSPLVDTLEPGKVSYFAVRAPGTKVVRVVLGDGKQYTLFPQDDLHIGCVMIPSGDVRIGAVYPEAPKSVVILTQYHAKKEK